MKKIKTTDLITKLSTLYSHKIAKKFILSLDLTKEQFEISVNHENKYVKYGIAAHPNLPEDLMYKLSDDKNTWIRWGLAENPNLSEDLMYKLYEDKEIRTSIAAHPNLPKDLMYKLSDDEDKSVRWIITMNPNLPEDLMYKLSEDKEIGVRWRAAKNPNILKDLILRQHCDVFKNVRLESYKKSDYINSLKSEDLEKVYDLINNSKYIDRDHFKKTFDYIADKFPELKKLAKMFKRIILKGKIDLK